MNRRAFLARGAAAVATAGLGCVAYAIGIEPHWLEVVERDLPIEHLPRALDGARVAQISDLHIGPRVSDDYVIGALDRLRTMQPDIVLMTGDFISYRANRRDAQFGQLRNVLAHLPKGRLATLGILGNHDYGIGWRESDVAAKVVAEAERAGMCILRNDTATVRGLDIVGVDDIWAQQANPRRALDARTSDAALVLVHNPDAADALSWSGYRGWMLAGHTHGGQCKPPFLPPPLLPVRNRRYIAGAVTVDANRTLYINRGIGHLIRARFMVRPEITMLTLRGAQAAERGA